MTGLITAWSWSRLETWERCPLQAKAKFVDKVKTEQTPAMARGDRVHKEVAKFLLNQGPLPIEAESFRPLMEELRQMPNKVVEQQWGFSSRWIPCPWFGDKTWLRSILDVAVVYDDNTGEAIDHKTGKQYAHNADQLELFALSLKMKYRHLKHVTTRLWYLDSGNEVPEEYDFSDDTKVERAVEKWNKRVAPMLADTTFAPRPNDKCGWCPIAKSKGGSCRFG